MKKLLKVCMVLAVIAFTTNTFGEGFGLNMANLNYKPAKTKSESKHDGGIEKGLVQFDASFNLGSHGPVTGGFRYVGVGFRPGATFNVDVAVHPYVSVGGYFGIDGRAGVVGLAFGGRGVFHIYQLIADKANTSVDPGDLDFYFPLHIGGSVYAGHTTDVFGNKYRYHSGGFNIGAGLGVRYYFTDHFGVMTEVGWLEMSVCKIGLAVKF